MSLLFFFDYSACFAFANMWHNNLASDEHELEKGFSVTYYQWHYYLLGFGKFMGVTFRAIFDLPWLLGIIC